MYLKKILCLLLAASMLAVTAGCAKEPAPAEEGVPVIRIVLDWTPNTNHTGLYVAQALGYYENAGIEVEILQPPEDGALALVGAGKAEFCIDFQESLGPAIAADAPLPVQAVAAVLQNNTSGIISLKSSGIQSPRDLEGKRFAAWGTPLTNAIIKTVVESDGGSVDSITMLPDSVTDVVSALQANVDAVWIYEGWDGVAVQLAGLETNYMAFADLDPIFNFYTPIIAGNTSWLEQNPELARTFLSATAEGYVYAAKNPDEAADILLEAVPELSPELIYASQAMLSEQYIVDAPYWGFIGEARWANFYSWMYEQGLLERELGTEGFTNAYLVKAEDA